MAASEPASNFAHHVLKTLKENPAKQLLVSSGRGSGDLDIVDWCTEDEILHDNIIVIYCMAWFVKS